ncbi:MAG: AbrB/MazE/SpoVT family DNA-binding domain-containing protein [Parvularculaceae bacterium]
MQVSKWGNSLAVRLPAALVKKLGLKEGDRIEFVTKDEKKNSAHARKVRVEKQESIEEMLNRLQGSLGELPEDYKFDREELHRRGKDIS